MAHTVASCIRLVMNRAELCFGFRLFELKLVGQLLVNRIFFLFKFDEHLRVQGNTHVIAAVLIAGQLDLLDQRFNFNEGFFFDGVVVNFLGPLKHLQFLVVLFELLVDLLLHDSAFANFISALDFVVFDLFLRLGHLFLLFEYLLSLFDDCVLLCFLDLEFLHLFFFSDFGADRHWRLRCFDLDLGESHLGLVVANQS